MSIQKLFCFILVLYSHDVTVEFFKTQFERLKWMLEIPCGDLYRI